MWIDSSDFHAWDLCCYCRFYGSVVTDRLFISIYVHMDLHKNIATQVTSKVKHIIHVEHSNMNRKKNFKKLKFSMRCLFFHSECGDGRWVGV